MDENEFDFDQNDIDELERELAQAEVNAEFDALLAADRWASQQAAEDVFQDAEVPW